jgi:hypothetical protein
MPRWSPAYAPEIETGRHVKNKKTAAELREESIKKKQKKHKLNQSIQYLILFN